MVDLSNLNLRTPKVTLRKADTTSSIKQDSSDLQQDLINENKNNKNIVLERFNNFMKDRADIRTSLRKAKTEDNHKAANTNDASAQMSLVFDFIRSVWADVYWNPEKAKNVDDPTIAQIAWLTWDNISYENIAAFNDFINNPNGWDLTWTVYQLVAWDTRMRQYMEAKYYWINGLESWENTTPTLYSMLDIAWRKIDNIPIIWWLLWAGKDTIWWITDAAAWTVASLADMSLWAWEKVLTPMIDSDMSKWVYNLDKQAWYTWTYEEWKEESKQQMKDLSVSNIWKETKKETPTSRYDEDEISSQAGKAIFTIWEMLLWWWEKKIAEYATKPWVVWKVANFLDKIIKAWGSQSEAKWYIKWLSRMAQWWVQWTEAQALTDLSQWELSPLEQYEMSAWIWAGGNLLLWWVSSTYENIKSPNKPTTTSLGRLWTEDVKNIWNQAKNKYLDNTLKTPTQKLWWEVETVITKKVKPDLNKVWQEIENIEKGLAEKTNISAKDAIDKINQTLDDKWINIQIEPVEIDWKIYYRASWGGNIVKVWDTYMMEQTNPYINSIIWDINKITPSEFNTAKWYAKVVKALKNAWRQYKQEWWDIVGKLWSAADDINAPLKDAMWAEEYAIYSSKNDLYSEIWKFQKALSDAEQSLSKWNTIDPNTLKQLEEKAKEISKLAKEKWYDFEYDLSWLSDKYVVWKSAEKFYNLKTNEQETMPRPSKWGAEKWSLEKVKKWIQSKPENWYKYAWDYTPSAREQMFKEVWNKIPWEIWAEVSEFTYN